MTIKHVVLGTGAIGRAVAEELVQRGESVRMVNRSGTMDEVPAGVEVVASDLYDPANVREVTRGAKVVYQASQPPYNEWPEKFPLLQKSILEGLTGSDAKLVLIENVYMYGDTHGKPMTEDKPHQAHTRKGRVRGEISKRRICCAQRGTRTGHRGTRRKLLWSLGHQLDDGCACVLSTVAWKSLPN